MGSYAAYVDSDDNKRVEFNKAILCPLRLSHPGCYTLLYSTCIHTYTYFHHPTVSPIRSPALLQGFAIRCSTFIFELHLI
ncbi:hypothetical protein FKM82_010447 [Ascaphus truei]